MRLHRTAAKAPDQRQRRRLVGILRATRFQPLPDPPAGRTVLIQHHHRQASAAASTAAPIPAGPAPTISRSGLTR